MRKLLKVLLIVIALIALLIVVLVQTGSIKIDKGIVNEESSSDTIETVETSSTASIRIDNNNNDIYIRGNEEESKEDLKPEHYSIGDSESGYADEDDAETKIRMVKPEGNYKGFAFNENSKYHILSRDISWVLLGNDKDKITISEDNNFKDVTKSLSNMISSGGMSNYAFEQATDGNKVDEFKTLLSKAKLAKHRSKNIEYVYSYYAFKDSSNKSNLLYASVKPEKSKLILNIKIDSSRENELENILKDCMNELIVILRKE